MPRTDKSRPVVRRLPADERRRHILDTALRLLGTKGFEGLRIRDVAEHVKINSATLHHYFPAKENLVAAMAETLASRFATVRAPDIGESSDTPPSLHRLRQEFADAQFYRTYHPDLLAASRELTLRAARDLVVAEVMAPLHRAWCDSIENILVDGRREGVFRKGMKPATMSRVIVSALWGMGTLLLLHNTEFARACQEIEASLLAADLL